MSWNLLIHEKPESEWRREAGGTGSLGALDAVRTALDGAFDHLNWHDETRCSLNEAGGFRLDLNTHADGVADIMTEGGYQHLTIFGTLCKEQGWRMTDLQLGSELDLERPYDRQPDWNP